MPKIKKGKREGREEISQSIHQNKTFPFVS
jgi:hypothetical protein